MREHGPMCAPICVCAEARRHWGPSLPCFALETGSLAESRVHYFSALLRGRISEISLSLSSGTGATGVHGHTQFLCGCWGAKLRSS